MFGRKKKDQEPKYRVEVQKIPLPVLIRQAIYDSLLEPAEEIAAALGLPPISQEVAEMEEEASQKRLEEFSALMPFIDSHSDIISRVTSSAFLLNEDNKGKLESIGVEDLSDLTEMFKIVSISSVVSCLSALHNLGLIETMVTSNDEH